MVAVVLAAGKLVSSKWVGGQLQALPTATPEGPSPFQALRPQ